MRMRDSVTADVTVTKLNWFLRVKLSQSCLAIEGVPGSVPSGALAENLEWAIQLYLIPDSNGKERGSFVAFSVP